MELPTEGETKQFLPDPVGGWMYIVYTTTRIEQKRLDQIQDDIKNAALKLTQAQAEVNELQAAADVVAALPTVALKPVDKTGQGTAIIPK